MNTSVNWIGQLKKNNKLLLIISGLLSAAALILLLISIFGDFETNWVLSAGLFCVLLGNICILIAQRKKKRDESQE